MIDKCRIGQTGRIVHLCHGASLVVHLIAHIRHRGDHVHVEFAAKALLNNLHVEQAEESASESEAESRRRFGLECERGIVKLQLLER